MLPSSTHLVLIPSYNPGGAVFETVRGACAARPPMMPRSYLGDATIGAAIDIFMSFSLP